MASDVKVQASRYTIIYLIIIYSTDTRPDPTTVVETNPTPTVKMDPTTGPTSTDTTDLTPGMALETTKLSTPELVGVILGVLLALAAILLSCGAIYGYVLILRALYSHTHGKSLNL